MQWRTGHLSEGADTCRKSSSKERITIIGFDITEGMAEVDMISQQPGHEPEEGSVDLSELVAALHISY